MADERYVVMKVECPQCKTKQKLHVNAFTGFAQKDDRPYGDRVPCINCGYRFKVMITDRIVRGPFPA